jgi:non-ribosomal peptide synthetase component F
MVQGIFGILKTGACYLPLSTDIPDSRARFILEDGNVSALLGLGSNTPDISIPYIDIDKICFYACQTLRSDSLNTPDDPAYIIYTSGTTGNPKGVIIQHGSVINRLNWMQRQYPLDFGDVIMQKTPIFFDVSVWELFWWSFQGATLFVLNPGEQMDPEKIGTAICKYRVYSNTSIIILV